MEEKRFNRLLERYKYSPEAVKELYEYYYPIIVRYINRQFRGEVDGQDVAQQFFLKLFQMKSYKIRTPNAWVRTVTKNIAIDILRKNGKQYRVKELLVLPDYTGPPDNVADILKVLSESEQQIMYLRYWEKYNLKEIAELIKMKYSSVKYIHRAAKKKLLSCTFSKSSSVIIAGIPCSSTIPECLYSPIYIRLDSKYKTLL